jgi:hypothetical protein
LPSSTSALLLRYSLSAVLSLIVCSSLWFVSRAPLGLTRSFFACCLLCVRFGARCPSRHSGTVSLGCRLNPCRAVTVVF